MNGKICYIEMPAVDVRKSAEFYAAVFGWKLRKRGDGATAFDDAGPSGGGQVSGAFVTGRAPSDRPGLLVYIMVDRMAEAVAAVKANGGEIVQEYRAGAPEIVATFRDPGGNVIGLYQEPGKKGE